MNHTDRKRAALVPYIAFIKSPMPQELTARELKDCESIMLNSIEGLGGKLPITVDRELVESD